MLMAELGYQQKNLQCCCTQQGKSISFVTRCTRPSYPTGINFTAEIRVARLPAPHYPQTTSDQAYSRLIAAITPLRLRPCGHRGGRLRRPAADRHARSEEHTSELP